MAKKREGLAMDELVRPSAKSRSFAALRMTKDLCLLKARTAKPAVGIIMGSSSDWPTMEHAAKVLEEFGVDYDAEVVSAHRTPDKMFAYAEGAAKRGLKLILAGAGGAAHLPGMVAAKTTLPVLGVPVRSKQLDGLDSLLSIAQMPAGIPVASFAVGEAGAKNAALFAVAVLALEDKALAKKLAAFRKAQTKAVEKNPDPRAGAVLVSSGAKAP